jgi:cell division protein FtsI (penicillin-binding protein 3)
VALRLVMVQVVGADRYVEYGRSQRSLDPIVLPAGRGSVFDRNGFDMALSIPQRTIWADPRLITNPAATARRLAPVIFTDVDELRGKLSREAAFVYVARQVSDEVAVEVEDLDLDGIFSIEEPKRINPADDLARSILGRADVDNVGSSGLELQYDDTLTGEPGEMVLERDRNGRTIPAGRHHVEPATPGEDLVLTVDRNLQSEAERILMEQVADRQAIGGSAIISDPETGDILALVNVTIDAETGQPRLNGNNTAVTANYEPGSVNKMITMAAAIEEGLVVPETELTVPDSLQVADHLFTDSHDHPTETMSVMDILTDSSNIGTILVAQEVGKDRLYDYLRDFGFGDATALDFPAEVSGSIREPGDWSGTDIGAIPIGQGISVTAMQMLYAYNAIANDGVYVPPKLVDEIIDADGDRRPAPSDQPHRVVSPDTARLVRQMMANVVAAGTGEAAAIDGYDVAGKTGTARKPAPEGGYRWEDGRYHYISTFAGFMPADDPKLSVIVVLDEPDGIFASSTAAPAFGELSRQALRLLDLPPVAGGGDEPTITLDPPPARGQAAPFPATTTTTPPTSAPSGRPEDLIAALPPDDAADALRAIRAATSMARPPRADPDRQG